jgi:hypothetical protein
MRRGKKAEIRGQGSENGLRIKGLSGLRKGGGWCGGWQEEGSFQLPASQFEVFLRGMFGGADPFQARVRCG